VRTGCRCGFAVLILAVASTAGGSAFAAGGPLGIDHRLNYDNSGIWSRGKQLALIDGLIVGEIGLGLWEGGETRLGRTAWRAIDASAIAGLSSQVLKYSFKRKRPYESDNPNQWFQSGAHYSFPSGEVAAVSAIVTPFVLEYGSDHPEVWLLEALPAYDAVARMKAQGHWQTDVLAGFAIGAWSGWYAQHRERPIVLTALPGWVSVGVRYRW
jgi:membrane-associated phospholipid phosphatase